MTFPCRRMIRKPTALALAAVLIAAFVAGPALADTKTLENVTLKKAYEPTDGVRLIFVLGDQDGKKVTMFLIITLKDYRKLKACPEGSSISLEYDEATRKVTKVKC